MSVTEQPSDGIPHGLRGYRKPYNCRCDVCKGAVAKYQADRRAARRTPEGQDELAAKRAKSMGKERTRIRAAVQAQRSESSDSVRVSSKRIGEMERAVIEECSAIPDVKATQVVAAKNLARLIDRLSLNDKSVGASVLNSATKQLMSVMSDIRGDKSASKATGRRKSGGRLATVGALTKVKRAQ